MAASRLDDDEKNSVALNDGTPGNPIKTIINESEVRQTSVMDSIGREQQTYIVNESGLYNVILRSGKPQAKQFRKWITAEVLPAIRKHGAYMTPETLEAAIQFYDMVNL